ncbi:BrnT family toxin [Acinetobacter puyangensis]|uniref:BrnT family toxin n=1 Tax=Acinetobacter puyangensis TaxID=1096779 RepID=UPI003A4E5709
MSVQYNFEWDSKKAIRNLLKHGISFEKASQVFKDPLAATVYDEDHSSNDDERWVTLGQIDGQFYVVVVHTYHEQHCLIRIRIISARPANKHEIEQYQQG